MEPANAANDNARAPDVHDAQRLAALGLTPHWLAPRGKSPLASGWQTQPYRSPAAMPHAPRDGCNLGVRTGLVADAPVSVIAVDLDNADALAWAREHLPATPWRTVTAKGEHWLYRYPVGTARVPNKVRAQGIAVDLRADGGQVVVAPSVHETGAVYREAQPWHEHDASTVPAFNLAWFGLSANTSEPAPSTLGANVEPPATRPGMAREEIETRVRAGIEARRAGELALTALAAMLRGEPYAPPGQRNQALFEAVRTLTEWCPDATDSQLEALCAQSVIATGDKGADDELATFRDVLTRGRQKYAERDALIQALPTPQASAAQAAALVGPGVLTLGGGYSLTDVGLAELFADQCSDRVRWCASLRKWCAFNGAHWVIGAGAKGCAGVPPIGGRELAMQALIACVKQLPQRIVDSIPLLGGRYGDALKFAARAMSAGVLENVLSIAQTMPQLAVASDAFDRRAYELNAPNGTVDLRTGTLQPHDPAALHSRCTRVAFDADAQCPRWERFMREVLPEHGKHRYISHALGYSLTGDVSEQALFAAVSPGSTGKSTLVGAVSHVLGTYARTAPTELFVVPRGSDPHPVAGKVLHGSRFVVGSETEKGRQLAEAQIKQFTGGDILTTRGHGEEFYEFEPTAKLWLLTNHRPRVTGTDFGIWRRIKPIEFTQRFDGDSRDNSLAEALRHEAPGILAWLVRECLAWQREGLCEPDEVKAANQAYREESDALAPFFDDCVANETGATRAGEVYQRYCEHCQTLNARPASAREFSAMLQERGIIKLPKSNGVNRYQVTLTPNRSAFAAIG